MAVVFYQLLIVVSLAAVRLFWPGRLLVAALVWSALTVINLFYPPLIVLQLVVVWTTYAVLTGGRTKHNAAEGAARPGLPPQPNPAATPATRDTAAAQKRDLNRLGTFVSLAPHKLTLDASDRDTEVFPGFRIGRVVASMEQIGQSIGQSQVYDGLVVKFRRRTDEDQYSEELLAFWPRDDGSAPSPNDLDGVAWRLVVRFSAAAATAELEPDRRVTLYTSVKDHDSWGSPVYSTKSSANVAVRASSLELIHLSPLSHVAQGFKTCLELVGVPAFETVATLRESGGRVKLQCGCGWRADVDLAQAPESLVDQPIATTHKSKRWHCQQCGLWPTATVHVRGPSGQLQEAERHLGTVIVRTSRALSDRHPENLS